jgi:hypothetical protein
MDRQEEGRAALKLYDDAVSPLARAVRANRPAR